MNIKQTIKNLIHKTLVSLYPELVNFEIETDYPKNDKFGDYTTNIAMSLAKKLSNSPQQIAEQIAKHLKAEKDIFKEVQVVKPGFINFYLADNYLTNQLSQIIKKTNKFYKSKVGGGKKIQIEFISANPTGPLTVGNARGGYLGDVLGNVFSACGYKVTKEYLINDAGAQIESLGHSVLKDDRQTYQGEYIDKLNKKIKTSDPYGAGQQAAKIILNDYIKKVIEEKMKIKFDVWFSEQKEIRSKKKIDEIVSWLKKKNLIYEQGGAWWFCSSKYGDDKDRVVIKSDGQPTYLAQDFAYHKNKLERGFKKIINIWGADHHGDINRLMAAFEVLGHQGKLEIILTQFIRLIKDGKEVRMSKRAGNLVYIDDLINEAGIDATRFYFLKYSADSHIDFDLNLAKEKSNKNPVYYVQYAYARICNILKQKEISGLIKTNELHFSNIHELNLIKELIKLPDILMSTSQNYQTQNLTTYAISLADKFHQFYTNCRVINNGMVNSSRVALIKATKLTLKNLFEILGISAPEKM